MYALCRFVSQPRFGSLRLASLCSALLRFVELSFALMTFAWLRLELLLLRRSVAHTRVHSSRLMPSELFRIVCNRQTRPSRSHPYSSVSYELVCRYRCLIVAKPDSATVGYCWSLVALVWPGGSKSPLDALSYFTIQEMSTSLFATDQFSGRDPQLSLIKTLIFKTD